MTDLHWMTALELADALDAGDLSSREITEALVARGDALEGRLGTFLHRTSERALAEAEAADARRRAGEARSRFDGIPVAYKDIFTTRGVPTTAGSKILKGFVPPFDATVVARSDAAGLPMLGKTNMDEFAMGSSTENSGYQKTRNPWDTERVPGGSSGGSAAAVAAGLTPWAWATDTGGSIRQPASLCSLVGVKPTYGFVSRYGMIAFASSLDQAGPLTRTVADAAALLEIAAGHDPMDSTSIRDDRPALLDGIDGGMKGLRIGVVKEFLGQGTDGVRAVIDEAYARLEKLGATMVEVSLPSFKHGIPAYYLVAPAECSSNLARFDGVRYGARVEADDIIKMTSRTRAEGFGAEVKRRIMVGTYALSAGYYDAYYGKAQKVRTLITQDLARAYEEIDLIATPSSPTTAFKIGERTADPLAMHLSDIFTVPVNLAGIAGVSVPAGLAPDDGLPVGLQLIAKSLDEPTMFKAAYAFEQDLGFATSPEGRANI